jgi:hypothetical protein
MRVRCLDFLNICLPTIALVVVDDVLNIFGLLKGLDEFERRCASRKMAFACVWRSECSKPSSPSVSYAVTMGMDCVEAPEMFINSLSTNVHRGNYREQWRANAR